MSLSSQCNTTVVSPVISAYSGVTQSDTKALILALKYHIANCLLWLYEWKVRTKARLINWSSLDPTLLALGVFFCFLLIILLLFSSVVKSVKAALDG